MRYLTQVAVISAITFYCTGCPSPKSAADNRAGMSVAIRVVDDYGDTLQLTELPQRIVSLNPATTEILFTIGAGGHLVGRSSWDEWPIAAQAVPALGNAIRPNVEAVLAVYPDLVILYASEDNRPAAQQLRAAGVRTLSFRIDQIKEFERVVRALGQITGDSVEAAAVADTVNATLRRVRAATQGLARPTVVWPFTYRPAIVVGGGSFLNELLEIAGATNLYASLPQPSPVVTLEDIVKKNPQYVLNSADLSEQGTITSEWRAVPAVREGRVLSTPTSIVARPSVQLGQAAVELAKILHPSIDLR